MREIIIKPSEDIPDCDHELLSASNTLKYVANAIKDSESVHFWQCRCCNAMFQKSWFKHTEENCPNHMWEFVWWDFQDNPVKYKLDQVYRCFMCGKIHRESMTVRDKGMKGGVPDGIEHPEVKRALLLRDILEE